jgi:hypothetical protein
MISAGGLLLLVIASTGRASCPDSTLVVLDCGISMLGGECSDPCRDVLDQAIEAGEECVQGLLEEGHKNNIE